MSETETMASVAEIVHDSGIGASEVAGFLGISPWDDPWLVWARKIGLIAPKERTPQMEWGKRLEVPVAEAFVAHTGIPIEIHDAGQPDESRLTRRIYSKERPWQYCTPDCFVLDGARRIGVLECKTGGLWQAGDWSTEQMDEHGVPPHYRTQVTWQMNVTGLPVAYIAVLIAGSDFRVYQINYDPALGEFLVEMGYDFWRKYVLTRKEPPMSASESAREYLHRRYPREREILRAPTDHERVLLDEYRAVRGALESFGATRDRLENAITEAIGDSEGLVWDGGNSKFTWRRSKNRMKTDWEQLAQSQMDGFSHEQKAALVEQFTHTEPGSRRVYWKEKNA